MFANINPYWFFETDSESDHHTPQLSMQEVNKLVEEYFDNLR